MLPQEAEYGHARSWPAKPSPASRVIDISFVLPDMVAKALAGMPTPRAMAWAEDQVRLAVQGKLEPKGKAAEESIACPVIGFFGLDDTNPSPADVDTIDAELTRHGKAHEFHRYAGAGHAFLTSPTPSAIGRTRPRMPGARCSGSSRAT